MLIVSEDKIKNAARNLDIYSFYKEAIRDGSKPEAVYKYIAKKHGISVIWVKKIIANFRQQEGK